MTYPLLYPILSKAFAVLYFPLFFLCIYAIDRANRVEEVEE